METRFKHIITNGDLVTRQELFPEDAVAGQEIELTDEQYAELGLKLHILTQEDIDSNEKYAGFGFIPGDQIEIPLVVEEESNEDDAE